MGISGECLLRHLTKSYMEWAIRSQSEGSVESLGFLPTFKHSREIRIAGQISNPTPIFANLLAVFASGENS